MGDRECDAVAGRERCIYPSIHLHPDASHGSNMPQGYNTVNCSQIPLFLRLLLRYQRKLMESHAAEREHTFSGGRKGSRPARPLESVPNMQPFIDHTQILVPRSSTVFNRWCVDAICQDNANQVESAGT